ncbi:MAG: hypothetical protein EZS26_003871 [Candidatus Ordinivivax streblomastigis]|uniref:Radical SAM protein n=1 Tax=Candidatus Ordinivivax streblomastigis TaxID=2540710 RepID=A0A5M8NXX0_9BACT|nr:MAG: hypothetical protein EZS26_003871 [Candidatus Ordinivivax streblomastigis]
MKIGLIDVDGHNFPNLALMKLAAYHRNLNDTVEWVNHCEQYDRVYQSKVFTFSPDVSTVIQSNEIIKGGTGYKMYNDLFCDDTEPDYTLYPQFQHAYGFLTRGCTRNCAWCIVPKKEGGIRPYRDIETVLQGRKTAILMDNNVLASNHGLAQLERIIDLKCKVDFNQGLDSRLVTDEVARLLSKIKWIRFIRFACDTTPAVEPLLKAIEKLNKYSIKNYRIFVYLLVKDVDEANKRCRILKKLGVNPFAQTYRDYDKNILPTAEQKRFAWYVNQKAVFKATEWKNYR